MKKLTLLGGLSPQAFFRDYWHKKPLLIRQAFPNFKPLMSPDALFRLAGQTDVESRLVSHSKRRWQLQSGPFDQLPAVSKKAWTLLVQGVNLHDDATDNLMQQFRFIPDARLDDLMISYATDAGGVGPHFDSYDVFLLQAAGQRRWQISAQKDLSLVDGAPLKILSNFEPEQEYLLEPGDMLYLPPQYAHDGVAVGECMTYSIGFRAPSYQELGEAFLQFMGDSIDLPGRYADPDLTSAKHPAEIGRPLLSRVASELAKVRFTDEDMAIFVGEYLSEPKANVFYDPPEKPLPLARFSQAAAKRGVRLSRKTRMLFQGKYIFINGESLVAARTDKAPLARLADDRRLDGEAVSAASIDVLETLHAWYAEGWVLLG
jgi:50S ribosomal protein L16 3-hydroxylase